MQANFGFAGGMEEAPNWEVHNRGISTCFFTRSDKLLDDDGHPILDATGVPSEHVTEICQISIAERISVKSG
jgi:hypothetical protein